MNLDHWKFRYEFSDRLQKRMPQCSMIQKGARRTHKGAGVTRLTLLRKRYLL